MLSVTGLCFPALRDLRWNCYICERMPKAIHDPATCPGCVKQSEVGLENMAKIDNPWLGCPIPLDSHFLPNVHIPNLFLTHDACLAQDEACQASSMDYPF